MVRMEGSQNVSHMHSSRDQSTAQYENYHRQMSLKLIEQGIDYGLEKDKAEHLHWAVQRRKLRTGVRAWPAPRGAGGAAAGLRGPWAAMPGKRGRGPGKGAGRSPPGWGGARARYGRRGGAVAARGGAAASGGRHGSRDR